MYGSGKTCYIAIAFIQLENGEFCMRYTFHAGTSSEDVIEKVTPIFKEKFPMAKIIMQVHHFRTEDLDFAAEVLAECQAEEGEISEYGALEAEYLGTIC